MPVTKKPTMNKETFISNVEIDKPRGSNEKKTKLTYYMTKKTYFNWKKYQLSQLETGKKVTFQSEVTRFLEKLFNK